MAAGNRRHHPSAIDVAHVGQDAYKAMLGLQGYINASGLEQSLVELVNIRASPIRMFRMMSSKLLAPSSPNANWWT